MDRSHVYVQTYKQLKSENRCTIIKEKYFINNAIKRQMNQNKRKIPNKQILSKNRCTVLSNKRSWRTKK
jgi:hypothetical protein